MRTAAALLPSLALPALVLLLGTLAQAAEPPTLSVLRLESSVAEQADADAVTTVLLELLAGASSVRAVDRSDVTMGDLALVYGCEADTPECLGLAATDFATEQLLYGKVEPFGEELTVKLSVYDSASQRVRPVYSRRIPRAELDDVLRRDVGDLLYGRLWELPGYLTLTLSSSTVSGADVAVDGVPYGQAPLARARVDAGERKVEVRANGFEPWQETVVFEGGVAQTLVATLVPVGGVAEVVVIEPPLQGDGLDGSAAPGEGAPAELPPDDGGAEVYRAPEAAWIALGIGGAALVAASITGGLALEAESDYQNELRERQSAELRDRGEALSLATNTLLGLGLGGLVVSGALFLWLGEWQPVSETDLALGAAPRPEGGASFELRLAF